MRYWFHIYDFISLIGVVIILFTYFLLQCGRMDPRSYSYSIYNIIGSIFILYSLFYDWNLSAVIIESFWVIISFMGFLKQYFHKKKQNNQKC